MTYGTRSFGRCRRDAIRAKGGPAASCIGCVAGFSFNVDNKKSWARITLALFRSHIEDFWRIEKGKVQ
jgi:hypothetical protein